MQCTLTCEKGYDFALEPTNFNVVDDELLLKCNSSDHIWEDNYLPECSGTYVIFTKDNWLAIILIDMKLCDFVYFNRSANIKDDISGGKCAIAKQWKYNMRQWNGFSWSKYLYFYLI